MQARPGFFFFLFGELESSNFPLFWITLIDN